MKAVTKTEFEKLDRVLVNERRILVRSLAATIMLVGVLVAALLSLI